MKAGEVETHVALPGGDFSLWRWICLRGAGFHAELALEPSAPEAFQAVERLLDAERAEATLREAAVQALRREKAAPGDDDARARIAKATRAVFRRQAPPDTGTGADSEIAALRAAVEEKNAARSAFDAGYASSRERVTRALQRAASDARLREAVTWQNRAAVERGFASLLRADARSMRSADRRNEELVASYLYRYATKNDTIGFFGPVGWMRIDPAAPPIAIQPGRDVIATRGVHFEQWAIDAVAGLFARDARVLPWQVPTRLGFVRLDGTTAHSPLTGRVELSRPAAIVLAACDGVASARELAARLVEAHPSELADAAAVYDALGALVAKQLVAWTLETGTVWRPEAALRSRIARIDDEAVRAEVSAPLDAIDAARESVAACAGDAEALGRALSDLEATFTRVTGSAASHNAGRTYGSRGVVFEDCRRDVDAIMGPAVLDAIGPALSIVLSSARWLTWEIGRAYDAAFRSLYAEIARREGSRAVRLSELWFRSQQAIHGSKARPLDGVVASFRERWAGLLACDLSAPQVAFDVAALGPAAREAFRAPRPGWIGAREHSPDLMISASSPEAIARGDFTAVLGEVHVAMNTVEPALFAAHHPAPDELVRALESVFPEGRVLPIRPKHAPRAGVRTGRYLRLANDYELESGLESSLWPRERALRLADLLLEELDGRLVVRTPDGATRFDLLDFMSSVLGEMAVNCLDVLPSAPHRPRVSFDRLVVSRETWRFEPAEMDFAQIEQEPRRFERAARFRRERGLPRFVFMRSGLEVKPIFVDFASPVAVNLASRLVRQAAGRPSGDKTVTVAEMLPAFDGTWLPDAEGRRYTSELRLVAVDRAR